MDGSTTSRDIRTDDYENESQSRTWWSDAGTSDPEIGNRHGQPEFVDDDDEESGLQAVPLLKSSPSVFNGQPLQSAEDDEPFLSSKRPRWTKRRRLSSLKWILCGRLRRRSLSQEKSNCASCKRRRRPFRVLLKCLAIALMLIGLLEFILITAGLIGSFFPSELESAYRTLRITPTDPQLTWPTDSTADISPIQCHSHNDYWRAVPLKSAIRAGCTGVEADVWLFPERNADELYIGHSKSSLNPQRTFNSLYINPLVELLEQQNPNTTLHPYLDNPRNGVFDTAPEQTLVLLIDFKTEGQKLWPIVSEQLEPLRQRQYLTYFNGTAVIEGPITVVVTGNAPFYKVVENPLYRDMFFDAPLELLGQLSPPTESAEDSKTLTLSWTTFDDVEERNYLASYAAELTASMAATLGTKKPSNQGQGHSGAAPKNPAIYTPANSYYASVSFKSTIGFPLPFLTSFQKSKISQQISGAHKQGLKVRYWDTPGWPVGMRNYLWRVLVEEGVDYLNVDDLKGATRGDWGSPKRHRHWALSDWSLW